MKMYEEGFFDVEHKAPTSNTKREGLPNYAIQRLECTTCQLAQDTDGCGLRPEVRAEEESEAASQ